MPLVQTSLHLSALESLAVEAAAEPVELVLVDDCAEWARSKGLDLGDRNPRAMAVRRRPAGVAMVVIRREYELAHLADQAAALQSVGWVDQATEVREPVSFLRFLVLHELAHLLNNWNQEHEQECNEWAFKKLGWIDA